MKRIIYTAVALIICASVFGIADYLNARNKGALVNYTDEDQTTEAAIPEKKTETVTIAKEKTEAKKEIMLQAKTEKKITKAKVNDDHYTVIIPNLAVTEKTDVVEKVDPVSTAVLQSKATDGDNDSTVTVDTKRRISLEQFSRAPIRQKKLKAKK